MPALAFPRIPRSMVPWAALAAACGIMACMDAGSAAGPQPADEPARVNAQTDHPAGRPGVPPGCSLEWTGFGADSVLNCPDVRPPAPR